MFLQAEKIARVEPSASNNHKEEEEEEEDLIISKLPDGILELLLKWLSIEAAARTSVISKRWKDLWMNLILSIALAWIFAPKDILPVMNSEHCADINEWIEFAAKKRVKKLSLNFALGIGRPCDATTVLTNFPMYFLRDLFMNRVNVSDKVIEGFFSNSPFLESLSVFNSELVHKLEITSPRLKYLDVRSCDNLHHLNISAPNLNIIKFYLGEKVYSNQLIDVNINAPDVYLVTLGLFAPYETKCFMELLPYFSQFKRLELDIAKMTLFYISHFEQPDFSKVQHLKIAMNEWGMVPFASSWGLLNAAPFLQSLSFEILQGQYNLPCKDVHFKWVDEDEDIPNKVKENVRHSHQNLKVVELIGFIARRDQVEFTFNLFENAVSLEKIIIHVYTMLVKGAKWFGEGIVNKKAHERRNEIVKASGEFVHVRKTKTRPQVKVDAIIIT